MASVSNIRRLWILLVCMFYWTDGLLLHSDDDLISAYQALALQVQAMKSEMTSMSTNATSLSTKMAAMETDVTSMRAQITFMTSKITSLESTIHILQTTQGSSGCGANYVRWGRTTCPPNGTSLVYEGYAAGSSYSVQGGAANYLCLPTDPQWDFYEDTASSGGKIFGAEYQTSQFRGSSGSNYLGNVFNEDAPCAVCSTQRSEMLMIPARLDCHPGWTKEYSGYLMAGADVYPGATEYVCVDKHVEVLPGGHPDQNGRLFYLVEGMCGSLKCPPYINGRELTCVVCSK